MWEIYPILFVAAFLRFYQINTTEFDEDQAIVFRMAHDAVYHGLLPATSNIASIRIVNPPAVIYLLMLPAAFSANPLWGAIFVGLFNVIAVLLTYIFVRRYYGRLTGIFASLLYATAAEPLYFSRFIWQQNLIAPFVVLFMFALFWGVVDRRKGWFSPALLILGTLFQLHETTLILSVPLLVALLLAPGTVRWRDLVLGVASLLLLFFPYLLWEFSTKFADLNVILPVSKLHAHFGIQALTYYILFLSPFEQVPIITHTLLNTLVPLLEWLRLSMSLLVLGGLTTALVGVIFTRPHLTRPYALYALRTVWTEFRADPKRCGFMLLLVWQLVPVLLLSSHAASLFPYYLLLLMPGPFILIGLFLSSMVHRLQPLGRQWSIPRYSMYALTCLVIIAQFLASMASLVDQTSGNIPHGYSYNTLNSLQDALTEADQLALRRHFNHIYISTDQYTQVALRYLAEQMQDPTTLFDTSHCLILPNPAAGPAVLQVGPYDRLTNVLLSQFARATLIDQPKRLGGAPFSLYVIKPIAEPKPGSSTETFENNLQLLGNQAQHLSFDNSMLLITRWSLVHSATMNYRTTYTYNMRALLNGNGDSGLSVSSQCVSTSMRAGDQLIVTFDLPRGDSVPSSLTMFATSYVTMPLNLSYGPFQLESISDQRTHPVILQTISGTDSITFPV